MSKAHVRYGAELRKRAEKVVSAKRDSYACPTCGKKKVRRKSNSVWECKSCGGVFAGGTYSLFTPAGEVSARLIAEVKKR